MNTHTKYLKLYEPQSLHLLAPKESLLFKDNFYKLFFTAFLFVIVKNWVLIFFVIKKFSYFLA